jgi:hypothetical protein
MPITANALLRIEPLTPIPARAGRITRLDDCILLHTQADFSEEPASLSRTVREKLGEVIDLHTDPRGIFFIPSVAKLSARTYDAALAEIAEGGEWGPLRAPELPFGAAAMGAGGLGALLGGLLEQMPPGVLESVGAAARGQPGAFEAATAQLRAAVEGSSDLQNLAGKLAGSDFQDLAGKLAGGNVQDLAGKLGASMPQGGLPPELASLANMNPKDLDMSKLSAMLEGSGIDMNAMQGLMSQMESALASDPAKAAALAEKLFGQSLPDDDEEDSE